VEAGEVFLLFFGWGRSAGLAPSATCCSAVMVIELEATEDVRGGSDRSDEFDRERKREGGGWRRRDRVDGRGMNHARWWVGSA
jgi:hypothetical protein